MLSAISFRKIIKEMKRLGQLKIFCLFHERPERTFKIIVEAPKLLS